MYTTDLSNSHNETPITFGALAFINFPIFFNELTCMSNRKQIIGSTHLTLQGPILILNLFAYQDNFYINYLNIIACTSKVQAKTYA